MLILLKLCVSNLPKKDFITIEKQPQQLLYRFHLDEF